MPIRSPLVAVPPLKAATKPAPATPPGRGRLPAAPEGMKERAVQRGAIRLLTMQGYEVIAVPNGAHLSGNKIARAMQMQALKADGLRRGFPDLIVLGKEPGQIGFMECKRPKGGKVSSHQEKWRDLLQEKGFPWHLVLLPEDALVALRLWGWRP